MDGGSVDISVRSEWRPLRAQEGLIGKLGRLHRVEILRRPIGVKIGTQAIALQRITVLS